jgi:hypothetical protein
MLLQRLLCDFPAISIDDFSETHKNQQALSHPFNSLKLFSAKSPNVQKEGEIFLTF